MTDESKKIVDALRCCHCGPDKQCGACPYEIGDADCMELESVAADIIERISEQVEHLTSEAGFWEALAEAWKND